MAAAPTTRSTSGTCRRRSPRSTSSATRSRAPPASASPVLGSGHPLADVFLLKCVAAAQRAPGGRRVLRPRRPGDPEVARSGCASTRWPSTARTASSSRTPTRTRGARRGSRRELHIVQPKLVVVMGERRARVPERARVPARAPSSSRRDGRDPALHADDRARWSRPTSTTSLDEQPAKTAFWNAFKRARPLVGRAAAVLALPLRCARDRRRSSRLIARRRESLRRPGALLLVLRVARRRCRSGATRPSSRSCSSRPCSRSSGWRCRCASARGLALARGRAAALLAVVLEVAGSTPSRTSRSSRR